MYVYNLKLFCGRSKCSSICSDLYMQYAISISMQSIRVGKKLPRRLSYRLNI
jgi:hypothetical protein